MAHTIKARMANPPRARTDGAGIDHDIYIQWTDPEEGDQDFLHKVFPIPNDRFDDLLSAGGNTAIAEMYKTLIVEFFFSLGEPLKVPTLPASMDFSALDDYIDAKDVYDAELATRTENAETMASQATNWIEGLGSFLGWNDGGIKFDLQIGD